MDKDLCLYRMERAEEALDDAELLFEAGRYNLAVNRLYYCLFYAASSLILTKDLSSARHSGVRALLNQHFVNPGIIGIECGRFYSTLFKNRTKADYGDYVVFSR